MDGHALYTRLLGIASPWHVASVDFDESSESVNVRVELEESAELRCPVCSKGVAGYDQLEERRWRHLDSCGYKTYLLARVPRANCLEHGVHAITVPWSSPRSRFTLDFEAMAITVLLAMKSQKRAAGILRLSSHQVHDIMHRAVSRGLARREEVLMPDLSLDEKSFKKHKVFATVLTDLEGRRVLDVCLERTGEAVGDLLGRVLSPAQMEAVKSVTMDMWDGFVRAVRAVLPQADIVFDRFHIARYLNDAVDRTRIAEHGKLKKEQDLRLNGSKFFWTSRPENLKPKQVERYGDLRNSDLETAKVWALKETFRSFFDLKGPEEGRRFFNAWLRDVAALGNLPLSKVAKMLKRYYYGLRSYLKHRTSNSAAEGTNSLIHEIKFAARGFRTFQGFRVAILFFLGKLNLNPQKTA